MSGACSGSYTFRVIKIIHTSGILWIINESIVVVINAVGALRFYRRSSAIHRAASACLSRITDMIAADIIDRGSRTIRNPEILPVCRIIIARARLPRKFTLRDRKALRVNLRDIVRIFRVRAIQNK